MRTGWRHGSTGARECRCDKSNRAAVLPALRRAPPAGEPGQEHPAAQHRRGGQERVGGQLNVTFTDFALDSLTLQVATLDAWPATGAWTAEQPPLIVTVAFGAPFAVTVT